MYLLKAIFNELFDEIDCEPDVDDYDMIKKNYCWDACMILYLGSDNYYYLYRSFQEPIGDYGYHDIEQWYKCNNNELVTGILVADELTL